MLRYTPNRMVQASRIWLHIRKIFTIFCHINRHHRNDRTDNAKIKWNQESEQEFCEHEFGWYALREDGSRFYTRAPIVAATVK